MSLFAKTVELCAIAFKFNSTRLLPRNMSFLQSLLNCSWFVTKLPKKLPSSKKKASQPWTGYLVIFFGWREKNCGKIDCHVEFTVTYVFDQAWPCWELALLGKSSQSTFSFQESFFLKIRNHFCAQMCEIFRLVYRRGNWVFFCVWANFSLFTLPKRCRPFIMF